LSRQKAYELIQRNAMKAWKVKRDFPSLLKADPEDPAALPQEELEPLFDYQYYLRYVDEVFERLGLTRSQWKGSMAKSADLTPRAM